MRRLCLLLLLSVLALPTLALGARSAPGDGSLVVKDANGAIVIQGDGLVFGQFDRGTLTVLEYKPDSTSAPSVTGAKMRLGRGRLNVVYTGSKVRFLFPGGRYVLRFDGVGIDISAVGKGAVQVTGKGSLDDGSFAVNGAKPLSLTPVPAVANYGGLGGATLDKSISTSGRFS
jgi:hypothetical protein